MKFRLDDELNKKEDVIRLLNVLGKRINPEPDIAALFKDEAFSTGILMGLLFAIESPLMPEKLTDENLNIVLRNAVTNIVESHSRKFYGITTIPFDLTGEQVVLDECTDPACPVHNRNNKAKH